jgi:hypothetical protein
MNGVMIMTGAVAASAPPSPVSRRAKAANLE